MKKTLFAVSAGIAVLLLNCCLVPAPSCCVPSCCLTSGWGVGGTDEGLATWYGKEFHGRRTASGEIYDMHGMTAAHRTLPFGTRVRITNLENDRSVTVRINDRGPVPRKYIIDLSYGAAKEIGLVERGVVRVRLEVL